LPSDDRDLVKQYLLGGLSEAERAELREKILERNELFELVREVEDDLIDDYARGLLRAEEKVAVERFLKESGQLGRIEAARALAVSGRSGAATSGWAVWTMAAAILFCIAMSFLAFFWRSQRDEAERRLVAQASIAASGGIVRLRLGGEVFRGSGGGSKGKAAARLSDAKGTVILELPGIVDGDTAWKANVESYDGVRKVGGGWGKGPVLIAIPVSAFASGRYRVEVRRENGDLISADEFEVER
jgi:hypothetical protein